MLRLPLPLPLTLALAPIPTPTPTPNQVKQALDEVVQQHRELVNPQRSWKTATYQLVSLAVLIGTLLHFTRHDMLSA